MQHVLTRTLLGTALICLATASQAHRAWILPGATVLSGDDPWATFDAAISNDLFYTDYFPMPADRLAAMAPDGSKQPLENLHTGKYRTTFDLHLDQSGTYRVYTASHGLRASWTDEQGEQQRWPGRGQQYSESGFAANVPEQAQDLHITQTSRRQETFVTAGAPDEAALAPTGKGLEMVPVTHPNDLYSGETATFQFFIDGAPASGTEITVIRGAMRYRNQQEARQFNTDGKGRVDISWEKPGMYWLEAEYSDEQAQAPAQERSGSYVVTLEVLPF